MATKKSSSAKAEFDPRSETVVLAYQGDDAGSPALGGIPARDLTEADICRIVYAQAVNDYDGTDGGPAMPDPLKPSQAKARALVELLLERRVDDKAVYRKAKASDQPEPAPTSTDNPTESSPVDAPAQPEA